MQDQVHGCPYRVFSAPQLTAALSKMGLSAISAQIAATKARDGHYQLACAAAFEGSHGCECDSGINHPNQVSLRICPQSTWLLHALD